MYIYNLDNKCIITLFCYRRIPFLRISSSSPMRFQPSISYLALDSVWTAPFSISDRRSFNRNLTMAATSPVAMASFSEFSSSTLLSAALVKSSIFGRDDLSELEFCDGGYPRHHRPGPHPFRFVLLAEHTPDYIL